MREGSMPSVVFEVCRMLEAANVHFFIERESGTDAIRLTATFVGERVEIEIFEDDHVEISRFRGDEGIEGGMELLNELIKRETEGN
jgi:hypothetical protein